MAFAMYYQERKTKQMALLIVYSIYQMFSSANYSNPMCLSCVIVPGEPHARSRALLGSTLYQAVAPGMAVRATTPIENEVGQ